MVLWAASIYLTQDSKNMADRERAAKALASMDERLAALRAALSKVQGPRDQRKLLLQIELRAKVYPNHRIEFEHMAGVNFEPLLVVEGAV
jgi:hypothetical protein